MSTPSIGLSVGVFPPAMVAIVGKMSTVAPNWKENIVRQCLVRRVRSFTSVVLAGFILPGIQAMAGSRIPPSYVVPLPHLSKP